MLAIAAAVLFVITQAQTAQAASEKATTARRRPWSRSRPRPKPMTPPRKHSPSWTGCGPRTPPTWRLTKPPPNWPTPNWKKSVARPRRRSPTHKNRRGGYPEGDRRSGPHPL